MLATQAVQPHGRRRAGARCRACARTRTCSRVLGADADSRPHVRGGRRRRRAPPVVVLSERLWARRFGADPAHRSAGRSCSTALARTVIGVVPQDFRFPNTDTSLWVARRVPAAAELANTNAYNYYAVARLKPGVDLGAAQAELDAVALAMQYPKGRIGAGQSKFTVARLQEHLGRRCAADALHACSPRSPRCC